MTRLLLFTLSLTLAACGSSQSQSSESLPDFSALYKTWTVANGFVFTWSAAGLTSDTDDHSDFCDCTISGSGNSSSGQVRRVSCQHRSNATLTATKCTGAIIHSDFNFTFDGTQMDLCAKNQWTGQYDQCNVTL